MGDISNKNIYSHVTELLNLHVGPKNSVAALWKLQDSLLTHVRSLEALEVTGEQYGVILTPLILSRLPHDIRMEWARDGESHESDLEYLLTFLDKEIKRRERSQTFKPSADDKHIHGLTPSAAALHVNKSAGSKGTQHSQQSQQSGNKCNLCNKRHSTEKC